MKRFLTLVLACLLIAGCCSLEKCEEKVGKCNKQREVIEAPPRTEWVIPPAVEIPRKPKVDFVFWSVEQILANPVGYLEVLYADTVELDDFADRTIDYLKDLELAREKAIAASETHEDDGNP
jgi:hypothetical protein